MKFFILCIISLSLVSCNKRGKSGGETQNPTLDTTPPKTEAKAGEGDQGTETVAPTLVPLPKGPETASEGTQADTSGADTAVGQEGTQADTSEADTAVGQEGTQAEASEADTAVGQEGTQADTTSGSGQLKPLLVTKFNLSEDGKAFDTMTKFLDYVSTKYDYDYPKQGTFCRDCEPMVTPLEEVNPNMSDAHKALLEQAKMQNIPDLLKLTPAMPQLKHIEQYLSFSTLKEDDRNIASLQTRFLCVDPRTPYIRELILEEFYTKPTSDWFGCIVADTLFVNGNQDIAKDPYSDQFIAVYSTDNVLGCRAPLKETLDKEELGHSKCMSFYMYSSAPEDKNTLSRVYKHVASSP